MVLAATKHMKWAWATQCYRNKSSSIHLSD